MNFGQLFDPLLPRPGRFKEVWYNETGGVALCGAKDFGMSRFESLAVSEVDNGEKDYRGRTPNSCAVMCVAYKANCG